MKKKDRDMATRYENALEIGALDPKIVEIRALPTPDGYDIREIG